MTAWLPSILFGLNLNAGPVASVIPSYVLLGTLSDVQSLTGCLSDTDTLNGVLSDSDAIGGNI